MCRERWQPDVTATTPAELMDRAVVVDEPQQAMRLVMHGADGRSAAVAVSPLRALAIAQALIDAATRRLA